MDHSDNPDKNNLPSEVRRTLLKAAWMTPVLTVVTLPAHAQTSPNPSTSQAPEPQPTTTAPPDVDFDSLDFTCPQGDSPASGKYTGQLRGPSGYDFSILNIELEVTVTKTVDGSGGTESNTKTFGVTPNMNGSFEQELAADEFFANWCSQDPFNYHEFKSAIATAKVFKDSDMLDAIDLTSDLQDPDPGGYCLVGTGCLPDNYT